MKTIKIVLTEKGTPWVTFEFSQEEQLKVISPLEFKQLKRALNVAYGQQKRSHRLEQYVPAQT